MAEANYISQFVKEQRGKSGMTQEDLAAKAGVGLRFIRELEQGKDTLKMDKVNQVLQLFGYELIPGKELNPYDILRNHFNRHVRVYLKNNSLLGGIIVADIRENNEITGWKFIKSTDAKAYQDKEDPALEMTVQHRDIQRIENI